jgi:hypothetical protein
MRSAAVIAILVSSLITIATQSRAQTDPNPKNHLRSADHRHLTSTTTDVRGMQFSTTIRRVSPNARVVSDNHSGWRLELTFSTGSLHSVEDQYGLIVDVVRDASDRPISLTLGGRLVVEYIYAGVRGPWHRKLLYELDSGVVLADITNTRANLLKSFQNKAPVAGSLEKLTAEQALPHFDSWARAIAVEGRRYATLPANAQSRVVRSILTEDPSAGSLSDRIDYTNSEMVFNISTGDPEGNVAIAIFRHAAGNGAPIVVDNNRSHDKAQVTALTTGGPLTGPQVNNKPTLHGSFSASVIDVLSEGFILALDRVRHAPACRTLFENFAVSGNERLISTFYSPPRAELTHTSCDEGALAFTHVGSPVTHLCQQFGTLSPEEAAVVLIHEALHFAGMPEAPSTEGAMTSHEISVLVHGVCGF